MTENEAIKAIQNDLEWHSKELRPAYKEVLRMAIQALEEIQQYRAIGTIEEFKAYKQGNCTNDCEHYDSAMEYVRTKTIDEFSEQFCVACCENTFNATINGIKNVEMMTLDGVTETIFEVAEKMKKEG